MVGDILKIKTTIPPLGKNILSRPQIKEKLTGDLFVEEGFTRPLTLFSAPAGFGKTTLVRKWLYGREDATAWLSIDEGDNDPERFWIYLVTALQNVAGKVGSGTMETLRNQSHFTEGSENRGTLLIPLLNDLFSIEDPLFLVLDDYYLIDNSSIHEDMIFFIENLPPSLHLVITTRSDPPWPLSRWWVKGKISEIRLGDLKFSEEEATSLFKSMKGLNLNEKQLSKLYQKTEGWVTGLQLAAISLTSSQDQDQFIDSFTGSHRHILHFLSEEVITRQPESVQKFLLETSILNRFSAPLCNTVTGRKDSADLLAQLDRENLFIIPLDEDGTWYRYHPLFADLLSYQLKTQQPGQINQLNEKASSWFFEAAEYGEAVRHAIVASNYIEAARILHDRYDEILFSGGPGQLYRYLDYFSPELVKQFPRLVVLKALYALIYKGSKEAKPLLDLAAKLSYENKENQEQFTGMLAALKAYYYIYNRELDKALEYADQALDLLPGSNYYWRMNVAIYSGDAWLFSGNPKEAHFFYQEAHHNSKQMKSKFFVLTTAFKVATSLYYMGRLMEAEEHIREALKVARNINLGRVTRAGLLWTLLGELEKERGRLEEAERCIERGIFFSEPEKPSLAWNSLFKVAMAFSKQDYNSALEVIKNIETIDDEKALPFFITSESEAWKARLLLEMGDDSRAVEALDKIGITNEGPVKGGQERGYLVLCRLLRKNNYEEEKLKSLINQVEKIASKGNNKKILLETLLFKAELEEQSGEKEIAETLVKTALLQGKSSGYFQLFIDEGKFLLPVLKRLLSCSKLDQENAENESLIPYIESIIELLTSASELARDNERTGFEDLKQKIPEMTASESVSTSHPSAEKKSSFELVEDLSARELEVLELISHGYSNEAISKKLFLSLGTVKWHTTNIYGKLGVRSRTRAVALARELNILA